MPVIQNQKENLADVQLRPSEFLLYTLTAGTGGGLWAFGCIHGPKLDSKAFPNGPYKWQLGGPRPSDPKLLYVPLDRGENDPDRYELKLDFALTATYQLTVRRQPGNQLVQDISYESRLNDDPNDTRPSNTETTLQTLRVTLVKDKQ